MNTWREMFDHYSETGEYKMREAIALLSEAAEKGDSHAAYIVHAANLYPELVQWLGVILDHVDYTSGACRLNEMVGAVLPEEVIQQSRALLAKCKE